MEYAVRDLMTDGRGPTGFALVGDAAAEKQALAAGMPAWL